MQARSDRLAEARKQAEEFSTSARRLLDYFTGVEHSLRQLGATPEDEEDATIEQMIREHTNYHVDLLEHKSQLDACLQLGHEILTKAHPDAIPHIKQWLTILKARWEEVSRVGIDR